MSGRGMEYIRNYYKVPAKRGGRIAYTGGKDGRKEGTIVGSMDGGIRVRLDGETKIGKYHPTWEIEYLSLEKIKKNV